MARDRARIATLMSVLLLLFIAVEFPARAAETKAVRELLDVLKGKGATARTLLDHKQKIRELSDEEFVAFCNGLPEGMFGERWVEDGAGALACQFALEARGLGEDKYVGEMSRKENHPAFREALIHAYFSELFGSPPKGNQEARERALRQVMAILGNRDDKRELRYLALSKGGSCFHLTMMALNGHENLRSKIEKEEGIDQVQVDPKRIQRIRADLEKKYSGEELERRLKITQQAQARTARGKAFEKVDFGKYELPDDVRRAFDLQKEYLGALFQLASHPDEDPRLLRMACKDLLDVISDQRHFLKQDAESVLRGISTRLSEYPSEIQQQLREAASGLK